MKKDYHLLEGSSLDESNRRLTRVGCMMALTVFGDPTHLPVPSLTFSMHLDCAIHTIPTLARERYHLSYRCPLLIVPALKALSSLY